MAQGPRRLLENDYGCTNCYWALGHRILQASSAKPTSCRSCQGKAESWENYGCSLESFCMQKSSPPAPDPQNPVQPAQIKGDTEEAKSCPCCILRHMRPVAWRTSDSPTCLRLARLVGSARAAGSYKKKRPTRASSAAQAASEARCVGERKLSSRWTSESTGSQGGGCGSGRGP